MLEIFRGNNEDVSVSMAEDSMLLVCLINIVNVVFSFLTGCFRALGIQAIGVPVSVFFSIAVEVPLAISFAFEMHMGIWGLTLSYMVSYFFQDLIFGRILLITDWQKIADDVQIMIEMESRKKLPLQREEDKFFNLRLDSEEMVSLLANEDTTLTSTNLLLAQDKSSIEVL